MLRLIARGLVEILAPHNSNTTCRHSLLVGPSGGYDMGAIKNVLVFSLRFLFHLGLLLFVCLPLQLVGILVLPFALLYTEMRDFPLGPHTIESARLPKSLKYFDNADIWIGRDSTTYLAVRDSGIANTYYWLAFRNPLNYFGYSILGFTIKDSVVLVSAYVNAQFKIGEIGDTKHNGVLFTEYLIDNKLRYEYYFVFKYLSNKCFRFRMGHKLDVPVIGQAVQEVFVIQPYHDYSGS